MLAVMDESHLIEMGIATIGRRIKFLKVLNGIKSAYRSARRNRVVWSAEEERFVTCMDCLYYSLCACCVQPPEVYRMTGIALRIRSTQYASPCFPCCGYTTHNNNIDLTEIVDVDAATQQTCC